MTETIKVIQNRRSIRVFTEKEIGELEKRAIIDAAKRAPTAGNMMLYSIINITDKKILEKLAITCDNQSFIAEAKMALLFVADFSRWVNKFKSEFGDSVRPLGMGDMLLSCQDTVAAAQNAVVAAESMGIGSCYIGDILENWEIHKELFDLPPGTMPLSFLVFGYPTQKQLERNPTTRFSDEICVFENKYKVLSSDEIKNFYTDDRAKLETFYKRKYDCDFRAEMNRSTELIIKNWTK